PPAFAEQWACCGSLRGRIGPCSTPSLRLLSRALLFLLGSNGQSLSACHCGLRCLRRASWNRNSSLVCLRHRVEVECGCNPPAEPTCFASLFCSAGALACLHRAFSRVLPVCAIHRPVPFLQGFGIRICS